MRTNIGNAWLAAAMLLLAAAPAFTQGRIANAKSETRQATQTLEREVSAIAARVPTQVTSAT